MKRFIAFILTVCLLASTFCITAFAAEPAEDIVLRVSALKKDNTIVVIKEYTVFEDGWNAAMELADDSSKMAKNNYDRVVVDLYADWTAVNGEFTDDFFNGSGFDWDTIYFQDGVKITLNMNGHTIDRGLIEDEINGEVMCIDEDADVIINNGTITGGFSNNGAGGIHVKDGAKVTLNDVKLVDNHVDGNGGAIYIDNGTVDIVNSTISFNEAGKNGGAIYVYNGNLSIDKNTVLSYNVAQKEGGAIYVDSKADKVKIEGYFVGNNAAEEGGAIYVNSSINGENGVNIGNVEMIGNIAYTNGGGAVYVDSDNNISFYGQVIMHGNSPDNLHINSETAIKENNMTAGSKVGMFTSWDVTESTPLKMKNSQYFFSDKIGYFVKSGNEMLYYVKGAEGAPSSYKVGNDEYELIKSAFSYVSKKGGTMTTDFYYSDGYFADNPKYYNEHLSSLAASMALAAMPAVYEGEYTDDKVAKNIIDMFVATGYSDIFVHYPKPEYFGPDAENLSTIGYAIAKKTIVLNGQEQTIIATAVRGSDYGAEWASNVTLGSGHGEAQGFGDAAKQVKQGIDAYVAKHGIDTGSVKFFITGYSRAGATSNLVAKKLTDTYGEDQVYAYCFEAPKGGVASEMQKGFTYTNIHNIINGVDIVATVGTAQMGFIRYGVDHMIPDGKVGSAAYNEQKQLMLAQLAAINEYIQHDDYFHEATLEYIFSKVGIFDMISENLITDFDCPNDWVPYFIEKLQEYSFNNLGNGSDADKSPIFNSQSDQFVGYRSFWADYEWYLYFDQNDGNKLKIKAYATKPADFETVKYTVLSAENAVSNLMQFYFGSDAEVKNKIVTSLDPNAIMANIDMTNIYMVIIDEWNDLTIEEKNKEFHKLWTSLGIEAVLTSALMGDTTNLTKEELAELTAAVDKEVQMLVASFYVVADLLLDFVAEDYDETDQDILGTLVHNIGNILQTHYHDVTYSWVRSYDSYYSDIKYVCKHSYGEWNIVKEASAEDYGVQMKTCTRCNENIFEAIPKIVTEEDVTPIPNENKHAGAASLVGEGSILMIVICAVLVVGAIVYLCLKNRSAKPTFESVKESQSDD